jgi:hypothetical protein
MRYVPASDMTTAGIRREIARLETQFDDLRREAQDHSGGGSPGEWLYERLGELEFELEKRHD